MAWPVGRGFLSAARQFDLVLTGGDGIGRRTGHHFEFCLAGGTDACVFTRWLAVVFGNARARHRAGSGRRGGIGRSLYLYSIHRGVHHRGVRRPRSGGPVSSPKSPVAAAAAVVLATCLLLTENQLRCWHDSETLFVHALAVTKNNHVAHVNLGVALEQEGKLNEALAEYRAAEELAPELYHIHNNLGICSTIWATPTRRSSNIAGPCF